MLMTNPETFLNHGGINARHIGSVKDGYHITLMSSTGFELHLFVSIMAALILFFWSHIPNCIHILYRCNAQTQIKLVKAK